MTAKQLMFDDKAQEKLLDGVEQLVKAVRVTYGPVASNALIGTGSKRNVTKDGQAVIKEVELEDPFENIGVKLVQEVAQRMSEQVGDGTSTASILAASILQKGIRFTKHNDIHLHALHVGIEKAVDCACMVIEAIAKTTLTKDDYKSVALVAANNDTDIANIVANAIDHVGGDGAITVEDGQGLESNLETVEGVQWDKGYVSPYFITDIVTKLCEMDNPYILIHEKKISNLTDLMPLLQELAPLGRPLLVIAEDVDGDALSGLVLNHIRSALRACVVKAPGFGNRRKEILEDLAIFTGGTAITEELGRDLKSVTTNDLGQAAVVKINKDNFTVLKGKGDTSAVEARIAALKNQLEQTTSRFDKEKIEERIAKLSGGVAVIKVGSVTELEMAEKKSRTEDAVNAVKAASEEGVVPGGGVTLVAAAKAIRQLKLSGDEKHGAQIIADALDEIPWLLAENSGHDGHIVLNQLQEQDSPNGFDARLGEYVDMFKSGIVDPAKLARCSIQQAASVAGEILTAGTLVTDLMDVHEENPIAGAVS